MERTNKIRAHISCSYGAIGALAITVLSLGYVVPFLWSIPFVDGVRDIQAAISLANGERFPLVGPVFANKFHLGPVWTYIQAIPLSLGLSPWLIPFFLGLIASSKFLFSYSLGLRIGGKRMALAFPVALALPGWSGLDFFNTTTPMLVPAASLACIWLAVRFTERRKFGDAFGVGFLASLAVHAHPSALLLVIFPISWCLWTSARDKSTPNVLAITISFALPATPMLIEFSRSGLGGVFPNAQTVIVPGSGHGWDGWFDALFGFTMGGPLTTLHVIGSEAYGAILAYCAFATALAGLLAAMFRAIVKGCSVAAGLLSIGCIIAILTFLVRENTPWYFVQPLSIIYGAIIAYGWSSMPRGYALLCITALIFGIIQQTLIVRHLNAGEGGFPTIELLDIRRASGIRGPQLGAWVTMREWPSMAKHVCSLGSGHISTHGALAVVLDDLGGLPLDGTCRRRVGLIGDGDHHIAGVPQAVWSKFDASPLAVIGSIGLFKPVRTLRTSPRRDLADPRIYPMRLPTQGVVGVHEFTLELPPKAILLVTRQSPAISGFSVEGVTANGVTITAMYADASVSAYLPPETNSRITWRVGIATSAPDWVDIVGLEVGVQP